MIDSLKARLQHLPALAAWARRLRRWLRRQGVADSGFSGSAAYWEQRYAQGGDSGAGSYGKFATFKARVLNQLFVDEELHSVVEFGCGDGHQLGLLRIDRYVGVDISAQAVARCRAAFAGDATKRFVLDAEYRPEPTDCALSLDVIYHLVEDEAYHAYMERLFGAAWRRVVVYSSNRDADPLTDGAHIRHRQFTRWVAANAPGWTLQRVIPNEFPFTGDYRGGSFADFYLFVPRGPSA